MSSKWYLAMKNLDFAAFKKAIEHEDLSESVVPYASDNVLDPGDLYYEALNRVARPLVDRFTITAWYCFFIMIVLNVNIVNMEV